MDARDVITIGMSAERRLVVPPERTVGHFVPGMPMVYATPMMILEMEMASADATNPWLEPGWVTVGTAVDIRHLAATPVGHTVRADLPAAPGGTDRLAAERDDADRAPALLTVGRGGVQGVADVDVAAVLDQHDAAVRPECVRRGQGALHQLLRRSHRPDSSRVLSTRTPRTSTDGQPCETGATCPGWPLPQLNAPPSTQVDAPPTASMAPQKSVVVA